MMKKFFSLKLAYIFLLLISSKNILCEINSKHLILDEKALITNLINLRKIYKSVPYSQQELNVFTNYLRAVFHKNEDKFITRHQFLKMLVAYLISLLTPIKVLNLLMPRLTPNYKYLY